jgi:hypothetical protein
MLLSWKKRRERFWRLLRRISNGTTKDAEDAKGDGAILSQEGIRKKNKVTICVLCDLCGLTSFYKEDLG